jgi:DNA-binding MarR family transcriptional regulator
MRTRLAQWSLTVQEYTALSVLEARSGLSNAQLARRVLVTPQSMIEILTKLEKRGLVERDADPNHGLIRRADLTASGRELLGHAQPVIHAIEDDMLASVTASDQRTVMRAMMTAMETLSRPGDRG